MTEIGYRGKLNYTSVFIFNKLKQDFQQLRVK